MRDFPSRDIFESFYPNVKGTALGEHDGELIVLVTKKVPEDDLEYEDIVPTSVVIDGEAYVTDVVPVGIPHQHDAPMSTTEPADHQSRHRPIPGGVSVGNASVGAGTIGSCLIEHEASGDPVVLTNSHVSGGAETHYQPASMDGGDEADPIATLREESDLNPDEPQRTDSALLDVDPEQFSNTILGIGQLVGLGDINTSFSDTFKKAGRTTGVTSGELRGRDASVRVAYGEKTLRFRGCAVFSRMSAPGDSGSLIGVMTDGGFHGTHLLFAGSDRATIAIPLAQVMAYHGPLTIPSTDDGNDGGDDSKDISFIPFRYQARVDHPEGIVDGDTVTAEALDLGFAHHYVEQTLRLLDIDTAERGHEDYDTHTQFVEEWIGEAIAEYESGTGDPDGEWPLIIETQKDQKGNFGRWLAHIWRRSDGHSLAVDLHDEFGDDILYESVTRPSSTHLPE